MGLGMKAAKEMFKELGYNQDVCLGDYEYYNDSMRITTDKYDKTIIICDRWSDEYSIIDMPTLKAIIKQCEELGWLDE